MEQLNLKNAVLRDCKQEFVTLWQMKMRIRKDLYLITGKKR